MWVPRDYQQAALDAFEAGKRRLLLVWHRRAGKDRFGLELIADEAEKRVGSYWHLYPLQVQAKRAIWRAVDPATELSLMDLVFPPHTIADRDERDMWLKFNNQSTYQLCGSDSYDRLVGSNVLGVLFSEWALCDPRAWSYIMPILLENGGWAAFITTYRGRNHAYQMVRSLRDNPDWFVDVRDITRTTRADGSPVVSVADVERERESLLALNGGNRTRAEALIREEFYCDARSSAAGAIYGKQIATMQEQARA